MDYALEITGLEKHYRGFALRDVSFRLPRGYIMGLIGPNGAGKTTIIKLIMNLIRRDAGRINILGQDNLACEAEVKSRIGFVYDVPKFHDDCSLKHIASAVAPMYRGWDQACFKKITGEFNLPMGRKFKKLSMGMRTQFALALALSHNAELVIMDEPTSGLDPVFRRGLLERLSDLLQDENKSILFSTHITSDLEKVADYITCLRDGKVVFSSARDDVLETWKVIKGGPELLQDDLKPLIRGLRQGPYGHEALVSDGPAARAILPADTIIEKATLEDIIVLLQEGVSHV